MKLNKAETFLKHIFDTEGDLPEITEGVREIQKYKNMQYGYASKNERLAGWLVTPADMRNLILCIFTAIIDEPCISYQALIGRLEHKINLPELLDRVKTLAEVIAVVSKTGLWGVAQTKRGGHYYVSTEYNLEGKLPSENKHRVLLSRPQPIESNKDPEYGKMLLGSPHHFHEGELCLKHLDKMNKIPLTLNQEFIQKFEEKPKHELDTSLKQEQWDQFVQQSTTYYQKLGNKKFYLIHKYCSRGRTYASGYYVTSQGASYKKASVELYHKEKVR